MLLTVRRGENSAQRLTEESTLVVFTVDDSTLSLLLGITTSLFAMFPAVVTGGFSILCVADGSTVLFFSKVAMLLEALSTLLTRGSSMAFVTTEEVFA